jgi:predicted nucleic acid-binding protein
VGSLSICRDAATPAEAEQITACFAAMPTLETPPTLWTLAASLGQECRRMKLPIGAHEHIPAAIAFHHDADIVTFNEDYRRLAAISTLQVRIIPWTGAD